MTSRPTENARPRLVVLNSPFIGQQHVLNGPRAIIGRSPECEIALDLVSVSRRHAFVEEINGRFYVADMGSRNGILVGGQLVSRVELANGDVITIGEVELRFEMPEAAGATPPAQEESSPRPLTGTDIMAAAQPVASRGVAGGDESPEAQQAAAAQRVARAKLAVAVILGLLVVGVVGAGVLKQKDGEATSAQRILPVLLKVGENRLVLLTAGDFTDGNITIDDRSVVAARRYDAGQLLLNGKSGGNTTLDILTRGGRRVQLRVLVRGRIPDPLEDLAYGKFSPAERRQEADRFLQRGLLVEAEKPYLALQEYEKAAAVLKPLPEKGRLYLRIRQRIAAVRRVLDTRWKKLKSDIQGAARNNDLTRAEELLNEAIQLIPNPNDPRHQLAELTRLAILRRVLKDKEKGKRGRR